MNCPFKLAHYVRVKQHIFAAALCYPLQFWNETVLLKKKKVNAGSSSGPREKERHDDDDEGEGEGQQEEEDEREGDGGRPQGRETPGASGNLRLTLLPLDVWPADDQWPDL